MKKKILTAMTKLEGDYSLSGYKYLCEAVELVCSTEQHIPTCTIYNDVAKKYNTTGSRVERAIRHFISRTLNYGNFQFLTSIIRWNPDKSNPTNSQVIYGLVEYIRREEL